MVSAEPGAAPGGTVDRLAPVGRRSGPCSRHRSSSTRALAAADPEGRLSVPDRAMWENFPFGPDGLRVRPLDPPVLPEPSRNGEEPAACWRCANPDEGVIWSDKRWLLAILGAPIGLPFGAILSPRAHLDEVHAAEMGLLVVRVERAVRALGHIRGVHVNKWGDRGAHLHLFVLGRPAGRPGYSSCAVRAWRCGSTSSRASRGRLPRPTTEHWPPSSPATVGRPTCRRLKAPGTARRPARSPASARVGAPG